MKRFVVGAALGAVLCLAGGAQAHVGTPTRTRLPRVCILAVHGRYTTPMGCGIARAKAAQGEGIAYVSVWELQVP